MEQDAQVLIKFLRTLDVVGRYRVAGEGVVYRPVFSQLLKGVALLGVKHLVLQVVGNPGRGVPPDPVQLETQVHAAVAHGEHGVALGIVGLADDGHLQAVVQPPAEDLLPQAGVLYRCHARPSFPFKK